MKIRVMKKKSVSRIFFQLLIMMKQLKVKINKERLKLLKISIIMKWYQYHLKLINKKKKQLNKKNYKHKLLEHNKLRHLIKYKKIK